MGSLGPSQIALNASEASARTAAGQLGMTAAATSPGSTDATMLLKHAEEVVALCQAQLHQNPDRLRAARLHFELGRLYEWPLGKPKLAAEHYQQAHAKVPEHIPTLSGARRVLNLLKQYKQALPLFDEEIRLTSSARQRAVLFLQKGQLLEDRMGQKREAREAYRAAADLETLDASILKSLERADVQAQAWDALDKTYEELTLSVTEDSNHRAALIAERARLAETRRADPARATELYRLAFQLDTRAPGVLEALKRLHYAQGQFHELTAALEEEVLQLGNAEARAVTLRQIAQLHFGRFGNHEAALGALERAHVENPSDVSILEELAGLFELHQRFEEQVQMLERLEALSSTAEERVVLLERMGQISQVRLGQSDRAIGYFLRAASLAPAYRPVLTALASLYEVKQQWLPLISILMNEAEEVSDASRRAACYARIGEIFEVQLGNLARAEEHHARALAVVPGYATSFKALARLYSVSSKFRDLVELYERAVDGAGDDEARITYLFKIGRLHEDALSEPAQAVHSYQRVLELDAKNLAALHALQRAAERGGRFRELIQALQAEAALVSDKRAKVQLLQRAGEVAETNLKDDDAALTLYRGVSELDPTYLPGLVSLGQFYHRQGRWEELIEVYRSELKVTPKGAKSALVWLKIADILERLPPREGEAAASYRAAVEMDPFNQAAHRALRRKLTGLGQWLELVRLLELELSASQDPKQRARVGAQLGEIYEHRLVRPDKALAAYEGSLAADGTLGLARDARLRLLAQTEDRKRLAEVLEGEAETALDVAAAVKARLKLAGLLRDELKEPARAVAALEAVYSVVPENLGALLGLEGLYTELGNWEGLAEIQLALARVTRDPGARLASLREHARTQELKFDAGAERARASYLAILQERPGDPSALLELERLALESGDQPLLAQVAAKLVGTTEDAAEMALQYGRLGESLEAAGDATAINFYRAALARVPLDFASVRGVSRLARRSSEPALLEEAAEGEASVVQDLDAAAALLVQASVLRQSRGDSAGSVRALLRALELNPGHERAAASLTQMLLELGAVDTLVTALTRAARAEKDVARSGSLWLRVAHLLADQKQDTAAGIAALKRVVQATPRNLEALSTLSEFYGRDRQWAEAVARLDEILRASPEATVLVATQLRKASLLFEHSEDPASALPSVQAVLKLDPTSRQALRLLLLLQVHRGLMDDAKITGEQLLAQSPEGPPRAEVLSLLGAVEKQRGEHESSLEYYSQALALVGMEGAVAGEFKDLLVNGRKGPEKPVWTRYVQALVRFLESGPVVGPAGRAFLELARILGDELRQPEQALLALQRGLAGDPTSNELRSELAARLKREKQFERAVTEYRYLLDVDAFDGNTWRNLAECFAGMQRHTEAVLAMAPLALLGLANDLEVASLGARNARPAGGAAGSLDASVLAALDPAGAEDPASLLLGAASESWTKVFPPDLGRLGVTSKDRLSARSGHPIRVLADRIASVLQAGDFELYLAPQYSGPVTVEFSDPISIVLPNTFAEQGEAQRAFALARILVNLARRISLVDKLDPQELELFLAAAARSAEPNFGSALASAELLDTQARKIHKATSWGRRRALEDAGRIYARSVGKSVPEWLDAVRRAAARAALLLADDLPVVVDTIRRTEGDLSGLPPEKVARGVAQASDLLRFWISDTAVSVRQRMGVF